MVLFDQCAKYEEEEHTYFKRTLFGLRELGEGEQEDRERKFWQEELPFLYLTLLQLQRDKIKECCQKLESSEYLKGAAKTLGYEGEEDKTRLLVYYSLDHSDLILAIKCRSAEFGARIINDLHQKSEAMYPFDIRNSYSVLGVRREEISDRESLSISEDEKIGLLELRIIERKNGSIGPLYRKLKRELQTPDNGINIYRYALLGTEDEAIIIQNLPWIKFFPLYRDVTGVLCNSNKCSQKYANAISAKIMLDLGDDEINEREQRGTKMESQIYYDKKEKCWNNEEYLLSVTEIDGSLFMDLSGRCRAIGVLVDGAAIEKGDVGRGARYNSIVNYIRQKEAEKYIGIVISEDGMVM